LNGNFKMKNPYFTNRISNFGTQSLNTNMKHFISIFLLMILACGIFSCKEKDIPKPKHLLSKKKMVEMLADIHLAQAITQHQRDISDSLKLSSTDLYYSVLAKYKVPDSIFVRSVIYYSSNPRLYEKIYNDIINMLKGMEEEPAEHQEINVGNKLPKPEKTKNK